MASKFTELEIDCADPSGLALHIDVNPTDREQADEVRRLLELGARYADVGQGDDVSWVVLADPEGNEFCVLAGRRP